MSLKYDAARPLFIAPEARLSIDQASQALDQCYQTKMPVLIYLHGRAKGVGEPKKSVESGIYRELAAYGVAVLGFTWDAEHLDKWLSSPRDFLPGTKMTFAGLHDAKDRIDLIAYLKVETGYKPAP